MEKNYDKVDQKINASDFEYDEMEEVEDPIKLVFEEYVKPKQNGKS